MRGKRIGIPKEYRVDGMPAEIEALWHRGADWLRDAGAEIVDISLPHTKYALPAYYVIAPGRGLVEPRALRRRALRPPGARSARTRASPRMYERTRAEGFGAEVRRRVMIGTYVLSAGYYDAYYLRAQKVRTLIKRDFETAFADGVDAILTPATPSAAFADRRDGRRRSGADVPQRRLHRDGEPRRAARRVGAGGARRRRAAARAAGDRPALGRGGRCSTSPMRWSARADLLQSRKNGGKTAGERAGLGAKGGLAMRLLAISGLRRLGRLRRRSGHRSRGAA